MLNIDEIQNGIVIDHTQKPLPFSPVKYSA